MKLVDQKKILLETIYGDRCYYTTYAGKRSDRAIKTAISKNNCSCAYASVDDDTLDGDTYAQLFTESFCSWDDYRTIPASIID